MPWHDWQFWLVTLLMLWGLWLVARLFIPRLRSKRAGGGDACPTCTSGASPKRGAKGRRVALTIEQRRV